MKIKIYKPKFIEDGVWIESERGITKDGRPYYIEYDVDKNYEKNERDDKG